MHETYPAQLVILLTNALSADVLVFVRLGDGLGLHRSRSRAVGSTTALHLAANYT